MSKDNRTIHNNVRIGSTVYGPGQEDELEKALSKPDLQRLTEQGAIEGFKGTKAPAEDTAETAEAPAEEESAEPAAGKGKGK
jgi:hypothetical protein